MKNNLKKSMKKVMRKNDQKDKDQKAKMKSLFRLIMDVFKERRVSYEKPKTVTIDKGGIYLTGKKKGDELKTYIIVGWVSNNEMKEYVLSFSDNDDAELFAKTFKIEYPNTRILQAIK